MTQQQLWEKTIGFHGHACGGLAIGFRAALLAKERLQTDFSQDEELVCIAETDACGVDAIQVILGCSVGKGNLLFRLRGKQAFSFYHRAKGTSVRLLLNPRPEHLSREESMKYTLETPAELLFTCMKPALALPQHAMIFASYPCEACGEVTAESFLRLQQGKKLCLDCAAEYKRFTL